MTLREYLTQHRMPQADFARVVGLSQGQVSRLVNGIGNVPSSVLRRVHDATKGQVTPNDVVIADCANEMENGAAA